MRAPFWQHAYLVFVCLPINNIPHTCAVADKICQPAAQTFKLLIPLIHFGEI